MGNVLPSFIGAGFFRSKEYLGLILTLCFIIAAILPHCKILGSIGFWGLALMWIGTIHTQGINAVIRQIGIVSWLSLALFLWMLFSFIQQRNFSENWHAYFSHSALAKSLLVAFFITSCKWSDRTIKYILITLQILLLAMNLRHIYLLWLFDVAFDFSNKPFQVLWQIRDCGQYIILLFPFIFLRLTGATMHHRSVRCLFYIWAAAITVLLLGTGLRGAYLGCFIALILWLGLTARRQWLLVFLLGISILYGVVNLGLSNKNIIHYAFARGASDSNRFTLVWRPTLYMINQSPFYGYGFGQKRFIQTYNYYQTAHPDWTFINLPDAHNAALSLAVSSGIPAMMLYILLSITLIYRLLRQYLRLRHSHAPYNVITLFPLCTLCAGVALIGMLGQTDVIRWEYFGVLLILGIIYDHKLP